MSEVSLGTIRKQRVASIGLPDAEHLSLVANRYGVRTRLERIGYKRRSPIVGSNPDYYSNLARGVLAATAWDDPELQRLASEANGLGRLVREQIEAPYYMYDDSTATSHATYMVLRSTIKQKIVEKDLHVELSGKYLERAQDIASFAIASLGCDVPDGTIGYVPRLFHELGTHDTVNTSSYWYGLYNQLEQAPLVRGGAHNLTPPVT